ncbi:MAG: nitric-oxide reductase large subunit [Acidobacteriota bacterium]
MRYRGLWIALGFVIVVSFAILAGVGVKVINSAPPIPSQVVTTEGQVLFDREAIQNGQSVWQSLGGQQIGSIWGHGAYIAPDWTADYLHRESTAMLDQFAYELGVTNYAALPVTMQAALREKLKTEMRTNTYDPKTEKIMISTNRAKIFETLYSYYADVFAQGRSEYAIPKDALTDPEKARQMSAFFWWTAWAASTDRPDTNITYTNNWPHEPLIGNLPTSSAVIWSIISVVLLLAGIGALIWYFGAREPVKEQYDAPFEDPLLNFKVTPSQRAVVKYFYVVAALIVAQVGFGVIAAHYGVEGNAFYGIPIDKWLPYSVVRTWHTQLGLFWIATSWLATGLFIAPAVGGVEPKGQKLGVNLLFGALLFVVAGSLLGEWLGIKQKLGQYWFWFGSQGYEYVDLGRFWQILLFGGMLFWLFLVWRALRPALAKRDENRSLLLLFLISAICIPLFYAAGLMYGQRSHIVKAEYWRWWVVHLWVEGFFEVFATVVIAFLFTRLKLLSVATATRAVLFSTAIFLTGGIIGTFHHLYFTGTPTIVLALGATFSALEVVPLVLVGYEAWDNLRMSQLRHWMKAYKWPIYFFVSVAFWNFVGAGLFGFLINPPISLYYMQGLNLTPVHGHTALFGVYGMLGIGLMLCCLRIWQPEKVWKDRILSIAFWGLNAGLMLMVLLSLLPIGLMQAWAAIEYGTWYARSAEFLQTSLIQNLRWLRAIGDTVFAVGVMALGWFILEIFTNHLFGLKISNKEEKGSITVTSSLQ